MRQLDTIDWDTPGLLDRISVLLNAGASHAETSFIINQEFRINSTRNAVIGISRRRKIKVISTVSRPKRSRRPNPEPRIKVKRVYKLPESPASTKAKSRTNKMAQRQEALEQPSKSIAIWEKGCKWPDDMSADSDSQICETFCGNENEEGKSYCAFHSKMVYVSSSRGPKQKFSQSRGRAMYFLSPSTTR